MLVSVTKCDSSSLQKKKSNIYMHGNNKLRTYCLIKSEYRMQAYLTSVANRTNIKMLAKLRCGNHPLLKLGDTMRWMLIPANVINVTELKIKSISLLTASCIPKLGINSLVRWGFHAMIAPKQCLQTCILLKTNS